MGAMYGSTFHAVPMIDASVASFFVEIELHARNISSNVRQNIAHRIKYNSFSALRFVYHPAIIGELCDPKLSALRKIRNHGYG
jgi:hypothetical protein